MVSLRILVPLFISILIPISILIQPVVSIGILLIPITFVVFSKYPNLTWGFLLFLEVFIMDLLGFGTFEFAGIRVGFPDIFIFLVFLVMLSKYSPGQIADGFQKNRSILIFFMIYLLVFLLSIVYNYHVISVSMRYFQFLGIEILFILLYTVLSYLNKEIEIFRLCVITMFVPTVLSIIMIYTIISSGVLSLGSYDEMVSAINSLTRFSHMFANKNNPGAFFVLASPFMFGIAQMTRFRWQKFMLYIGSASSTMLVLLLLSRGSIVALIAAWMTYLLLTFASGLRLRTAFLVMFAIVLIIAPLANTLFTTFQSLLMEKQYVGRLDLIKTSFAMIAHYPIFGIGFSENEFMNVNARFLFRETLYAQPHNSYLYYWVFGGTPLFLAFIAFLYSSLKPTLKVIRIRRQDPMVIGGAAAIMGFLVNMLTDRVLFFPANAHLFIFVLCMLYLYSTRLITTPGNNA